MAGTWFSLAVVRYANSLVICWADWLFARARVLSRWSERRREIWGGEWA